MKFRWTNKELQEVSNEKFIETLITERQSELSNIYAPLNKKCQEAKKWLEENRKDKTI